uniref:Uncharacterized protein n=1 Tax=Mimivirus LCMiAC01 TaxID=2506608 RepID=A0A481YZX4_9VIRU|nr:MAG: hypothetical protein LCMiAC01_04850 [Mimivirus LCMiAC01]
MYINNIYQSKFLKYPLTDNEYKNINNVWKFLKIFKKKYLFLANYRKYVINNIRNTYTIDEFYMYESILNKIFWNLRWLVFPLVHNINLSESEYQKIIMNNYDNATSIPQSLLLCKFEKYKNDDDLENKLYSNDVYTSGNYYRSFINKLIIIDKKNKILISKPLEGSSNIFAKNYFNLLTITILFNKKLYKKIMTGPYLLRYRKFINKLFDGYYYQFDYGFPNLNYCVYTFGTKEDRINRIRKMYYNYHPNVQSRMWSRLIK